MYCILVAGMPASGKSTIAALLAEWLHRPVLDSDAQVVETAGMSIPDIFAAGGEDAFRARETAALAELGKRSGFNIYASSFFTALNNGLISALISFGRTLVFQIFSVLLLPAIFGLTGVWCAIVVAEALALVLSATCLIKLRGRYHYA